MRVLYVTVVCLFMILCSTLPAPTTQLSADSMLAVTQFAVVTLPASDIPTWCAQLIQSAKSTRAQATHQTTKAQLLGLLNKIDIDLGNAAHLSGLLQQVHPNDEVRQAATTCSNNVISVSTQLSLDQDLYTLAKQVSDQHLSDSIDQRRFDRIMREFRRSGVTINDSVQRQRVLDLTTEIEDLSTQFQQNLNADTRRVSREANNTVALLGLPQDFIASHTNAEGMVVISTDYPDFQPAIKMAEDENLRRELYSVYHNRGFPQNIKILDQVLAKRHEKAQLLGYRDWAQYATEVMMMKSADNADKFLSQVDTLVRGRSQQELSQMKSLKQQGRPGAAVDLFAFDSSFLAEKVRSTSFKIDSQDVASYFTYESTRDGVLATAQHMYNLKFTKISDGAVWHPDVEQYQVAWADAPGKPIARFYLDMSPRPNKYKHAAHFPIRVGVKGVQVPEAALICNFPRSGPMEHNQVVTFFHEFGHLMHHIIGGQRQAYAEFSGVATEWDFVEAPSQMMENWAYDTPTLQSFARHKDTGQPIPADLVSRLKDAQTFGRGVTTMQQTFYAKLSLRLHTADPKNLDTTSLLIQTSQEFAPFPHVPETHMHAGFGHLMGYSAVYFTYLWSHAISQQMLQEFKSHGSLNDPQTSLRYRDTVLAPGGTADAAALVRDFTKHDVSLDAFHAWLQESRSGQ